MTQFNASVYIKLKNGVNDPQGLAVISGLKHLGFKAILSARVGKIIDITLDADSAEQAKNDLNQMCEQLLANPVIEDFDISISDA
jgi:phosphoribosylformylglycinamidine synthase